MCQRSFFDLNNLKRIFTVWKVSKYRVFSGLYFPVFGLNADIYGVNLRIQSEYRKIRTRKNSVCGRFLRSNCGNNIKNFWYYSHENKWIISRKIVRLFFWRLFELFSETGLYLLSQEIRKNILISPVETKP